MKQTSGYCDVCERRVYATGRTPNHVLHLILTLCTGGLWGVVWICLAAGSAGNYRCTRCGSKVSKVAGDAGRYGHGEDDDDD